MSREQLGGTLGGRYEVEARIGAGGMGEVYRARDLTLGRTVAIKRLSPGLESEARHRERLLAEARTAARLNHQGLAALYDIIDVDGRLVLVMEYVEGVTLGERLRDPVDPIDALEVMLDCAAALAAAHKAGIVHYDLKPANIMITPEGRPKILDFGLAQIVAAADPERSTREWLSSSQGIAGTPPYMAPEVLLGRKTDARADIFSLGVVFYEMLTGHNPFRAGTPTAAADLILHLDPPPLGLAAPSVPAKLEPILTKMLAKSPHQRYATVADLLVDLRALASSLTHPSGMSARNSSAAVPGGAVRVRPWMVGVAVLSLAAAIWVAPRWMGGDGPRQVDLAGVGGLADIADTFLAVLPVAAGDDRDRLLRDGLASTVSTRLTQLSRDHPFQMVAASSMDRVATVAEARREFGVNRVLTFMLQQQGGRIRVNLELVDAASGVQLDAASVEGDVDDLLGCQDRVADRILRMLRIQLRPIEREMLSAGTEHREAYGYYVSGLGYLGLASVADLELAVEQFRQALRLDSGFVAAHAALGRAAMFLFEFTETLGWVDVADESCRQALVLDELNAEAHDCAGQVLKARGRLEEAVAEFEESVRLDPTSSRVVRGLASTYAELGRPDEAERLYREAIDALPHHSAPHSWLATFYLRAGRVDEAIVAFERAAELAPDAFRTLTNLGSAYFFAERWPDAQRTWQRAADANPEYAPAHSNLATVMFYEGDFASAARHFELAAELAPDRYVYWGNLGDARWFAPELRSGATTAFERAVSLVREQLRINPGDNPARLSLGYYLAMLGQADAARREIEGALAALGGGSSSLYKAAQAYRQLGDTERALDLLEQAVAAGASVRQLRTDPFFLSLGQDERYRRLVGA